MKIIVTFEVLKLIIMEKYSKLIRGAFNKWSTLCELQPENESTKEYANWKRRDRVAGNKFEAVCKAEGLNYIEVYKELCGPNVISANELTRVS